MNTKKLIAVICICMIAVFSLASCGKSSGEKTSDGESIPEFDFGKVEWSVYSGVSEGNRIVKFDFDNNTEYDIASFDLDFKIKEDVTEDEINKFAELKQKAKDMEHDPEKLTISATTTAYTEAGSSYKGGNCNLDGTVQFFTEYDAYELFEPDMMTITFVENNKLFTAYYDYKENKVSYDDESLKAFDWSDSKLAKTLPKPDAKIAVVTWDEKDHFDAKICGVDESKYKEYIKACKEKGYNKNIDDDTDWMWEADNKEGKNLEMIYSDDDDTISLYLNAPEDNDQ